VFRQQVVRGDGQVVDLLQRRAHLSYCFNACCCGRVDRGFPAVPTEAFTNEWLRRGLRKVVHLTKGGCLGPCTLANVASLLIDGRSIWFHSVNSAREVTLIFDYIESLVTSAQFLPAPPELAEHIFNFYDWDARVEPPCGCGRFTSATLNPPH
jgi:cobaltochelatase CobN